jgi:pimeloyl-ACP methyl ester carboxylesterase
MLIRPRLSTLANRTARDCGKRRRILPWTAAIVAGLICAAMAGAGARAQAAGADTCAQLANSPVDAREMDLPTRGAVIASATWVSASPDLPAYCKVLGSIAPVDPTAPAIEFELNLPADWNGKAVQYGGGGFNGVLITGLDPLRDQRPDMPAPLGAGYATVGTDSGHKNVPGIEIQAFALNAEALQNFTSGAYPKVHDLAVTLIRRHYGTAPKRFYFFGGSEGGREGLTMAQRFPEKYDGIVSVVPVINWVGLQFAGTRTGLAQQQGGWLNPAKVALLHNAVLSACDALDGAEDGVVSNGKACLGKFQPRVLRCANGEDLGNTCLSDAQIAAVETLHRPFEFPFPLANGVTVYPGWGYGGEDQPDGMVPWQTGPEAPTFPPLAANRQSRAWYYGNGAMRYFIAQDPAVNPRQITPTAYADRVRQVSALMDSTNPDLSAFRAHGGKLILKENGADFAQSPYAGMAYYQSVVDSLGAPAVASFLRLYVTPGVPHSGAGMSGATGLPLPQGVDLLGTLDAWVERGTAPGDLVQTRHDKQRPFAVTASRPLCQYPTFPRYRGTGSLDAAESFTCAAQ